MFSCRPPRALATCRSSFVYRPWLGSDGNSNGRPWGMNVGSAAGGNSIFTTWYSHDTYGNPVACATTEGDVQKDSTAFSYDGQNRVTGGYGEGFVWQHRGVRSSIDGVTLGYDSVHTHAVELVGGVDRYDYNNRYLYARGNPVQYNDPSGHQSCAAGDTACWQNRWSWMNRWYEAHGYFWSPNANHWTISGDAQFADEGILDDTVGEAGIQWDSMLDYGSWTFERKVKIATGIVKFGQRLSGGLGRIAALVGGRATMAIVNGGNLLCRFGNAPCSLPTWGNTVLWPAEYIDARSKAYIAAGAVHELAHVIDWQSGQRFSGAWASRGYSALTTYGGCQGDCVHQWESWAEAVATFTYGSNYVYNLTPRGPVNERVSAADINLQINAVQALLEGWVQP